MEKKKIEIKQLRFLLVVPLLTLPFVAFTFSVMGGGTKDADAGLEKKVAKGLKMELPEVQETKTPEDKLSYYDMARLDSVRRAEMLKNDPYAHTDVLQAPVQTAAYPYAPYTGHSTGLNTAVYNSPGYPNTNEQLIYQKLNSLNTALNQNPEPQKQMAGLYGQQMASTASSDIDRLEKMMQMMNASSGSGGGDPEMQQISGVLEKLLDIQHPDRVEEKLRKTSEQRRGQVFSVSAQAAVDPVSLLQTKKGVTSAKGNGFYSTDEEPAAAPDAGSIRAVVHGTQVLVSGSIVKMRLLNDIYVNGVLIPKDNFVFGTAAVSGERLSISIDNIRYGNLLFPVSLSVYDLDGLTGIHIPGAISRDAAKDAAANSVQGIGMTSLDPSLSMQAASAGIELTKNLISKKVKLVKVTVKAGYQVLFKDENAKNNN